MHDQNPSVQMSHDMRFSTMWYVRPSKLPISLRIHAVWSEPLLSLEYSMNVKLLTEHHLEFLSLKWGCTGFSESTLVKMPHCWKSHVTAHFILVWKTKSISTNGVWCVLLFQFDLFCYFSLMCFAISVWFRGWLQSSHVAASVILAPRYSTQSTKYIKVGMVKIAYNSWNTSR